MKLAFLGTGSAYSLERYNGAVVVDDRILLDGGAPLLPHMHRLGIDPAGIGVVFVSHFHGDHLLGLPPFVLYRALAADGTLEVVGPEGIQQRLEQLFEFCWLQEWQQFRDRFELRYTVAQPHGNAAGVEYESVHLDHGQSGGTGYRLRIGSQLRAYAGDTEPTPPVDELVRDADIAIVEATGPGEVPSHTSWEKANELVARHPGTRFFLNHVFAGDIENGVHDLEVVTA